jgi:hypothetical protein
MTKKHKQLAAARARTARWKNRPLAVIACPTGAQPPSPLLAHSADIPEALGTEFSPIDLDLDCLSDCGYTGCIDFHQSDDEYEPDSPSGSEWSDDESLWELEGGDLEENLKGLRTETLLDKLSQPKTSVWYGRKQSRTGLLDTMASPVEHSAGGIKWLEIELNVKKR